MPVPERISSIAGLRSVLTDGAGRTVITTLQTLKRAISPIGSGSWWTRTALPETWW